MLKTILTVSSMFRVFRSFILRYIRENELTKNKIVDNIHMMNKIYFKKDAFSFSKNKVFS